MVWPMAAEWPLTEDRREELIDGLRKYKSDPIVMDMINLMHRLPRYIAIEREHAGLDIREACAQVALASEDRHDIAEAIRDVPVPGVGDKIDPAKAIMDEAWSEFGGNHQSAEFWNAFADGVTYTTKRLA